MKFEKNSTRLLSITKSKAKMHEFGLDESHHIRLAESPSKLLLMTIGILGDLCRTELSTENSTELYEQKRSELRNAARYFDALIGSRLESEYDYYLCILGASSYYLADMPGSAAVLAGKLAKLRVKLTNSELERVLEWLLLSNIKEPPNYESETSVVPHIIKLVDSVRSFFGLDLNSKDSVRDASLFIRDYFHAYGTDRELLLADIIASIVKRKIENSSLNLLPRFTALPLEAWLPALSKETFISEFWPAQKLLGEAGVFSGHSAVVQLPTSAGKTKSAELIIRSSFLAGRASTAVIIAPFRSLCREISESLSVAFTGEDVLINQLNDVPQIDNFDIDLFFQLFEQPEGINVSPTIIVSTPEKLVYLLRHKPELAKEISLVIYDEGHQFDTGARGVTYELLLTSLKQELKPETQHVLISAVLSNAASIGEWLYAGDGKVVNGAGCLSTERSVAFSSWVRKRGQFHYVEPLNPNEEEFFVPRVLEPFPIPLRGRERLQRFFPVKTDKTSIAAYLGLKLSEQGPVAVFCGTKVTVAKICKLAVDAHEQLPQLPVPRASSDELEIQKIANLASTHLGQNTVLVKAIEIGLLPHSAGIPNGLRISTEYAMEHGLGRCVICTSTLAQGVNLPIKYLVVSGVFQGRKRISTRDFHNLLGRAGRSGKHTEGSIIFTDTELYDARRSHKRWHWDKMSSLLDPSQSEHCSSSLLTIVQPFIDDPFGIDPIDFIKAPDKYENQLVQNTESRRNDWQDMLNQMQSRRAYMRSLESFVLANSDDGESIEPSKLIALYTSTFAYSLATTDEKQKLEQVFNMVAHKVNQIEPSKRSYYGKALLGIEDLNYIEYWLHTNIASLSAKTEVLSVLDCIWEVIKELTPANSLTKLVGEGADLNIAKMWCSGVSYFEILELIKKAKIKYRAGTQERELTIENVIDICDSSLGYDAMLIAGACGDLLENIFDEPDVTELIRNLQVSLKIGLLDGLAISLYHFGFADRVVATEVQNSLRTYDSTIKAVDKATIRSHQHAIEPILDKYPSVFSNMVFG